MYLDCIEGLRGGVYSQTIEKCFWHSRSQESLFANSQTHRTVKSTLKIAFPDLQSYKLLFTVTKKLENVNSQAQ